MKAAIFDKYGLPEVLRVDEVKKPSPNENEILIKVKNCAVTSGDNRIRGAEFPRGFSFMARLMFGVSAPRNKILGSSFSGIVENIGSKVTHFKVGDEVMGMTGVSFGAYAEYLTIAESKAVIKKPVAITHEDASAISFGGTTALFFLRDKVKISRGDKVLVNGASGAVGTNALQIAKYYGAIVTAVCSSSNIELVKSLGADKVIDYTKQDLIEEKDKYDIVMDTVGNIPVNKGLELLTEKGVLILVVAGLPEMLKFNKRIIHGTAPEKKEDLQFLVNLTQQGKLIVVIDKVYRLEDIVDAHKHVATGHKKGNIVLQVS
jgi:NADPH:quinone reductase-like Zn-dependent oxidoreductase